MKKVVIGSMLLASVGIVNADAFAPVTLSAQIKPTYSAEQFKAWVKSGDTSKIHEAFQQYKIWKADRAALVGVSDAGYVPVMRDLLEDYAAQRGIDWDAEREAPAAKTFYPVSP